MFFFFCGCSFWAELSNAFFNHGMLQIFFLQITSLSRLEVLYGKLFYHIVSHKSFFLYAYLLVAVHSTYDLL